MLRLEEIIGLEVLSSDAKLVGTVESVGVDTESWHVGALKVIVTKGMEASLGVKKPLFGAARIAFPSDKVESVKDVVKMKEPLAKMAPSEGNPHQVADHRKPLVILITNRPA